MCNFTGIILKTVFRPGYFDCCGNLPGAAILKFELIIDQANWHTSLNHTGRFIFVFYDSLQREASRRNGTGGFPVWSNNYLKTIGLQQLFVIVRVRLVERSKK
ncbi:MAG TPA: hypothetical protein PLE10_04285 [Brevefilum sp.]|nr:hypothetical protein [Brevefilum sp.]HPL69288.1 hypothetical protein [Brevefilum sp.]